jgi:hypothetical protein
MQLSVEQKSALDRVGRPFTDLGGLSWGQWFQEQVLDPIERSAAGITADARAVNGIALLGTVPVWDQTTTPGTTLDFAWLAFRFNNLKADVTVSAGSLTLSPSATNYVEADRAGTVTKNTTGFTSGRRALFQVVTGASTYAANNVTAKATPYTVAGDDAIDGSLLSVAAQTKEVSVSIGTLSATTSGTISVPAEVAAGSKLKRIRFATSSALATDNTNYWDFGAVNKQAGAGAQVLADRTAAANSTKTTGGTALVAYAGRDLTLATLTAGTERDVTGGHTIEWTITKNGTAANLNGCSLIFEFAFEN